MIRPGRTSLLLAVGFLLLDAVLLGWIGVAQGRSGPLIAAGACIAGAVGVIAMWRRYMRAWREYQADRRAMRADVDALRRLLTEHHIQN